MIKCIKCEKFREISDFYQKSKTDITLRPKCKHCSLEENKIYRKSEKYRATYIKYKESEAYKDGSRVKKYENTEKGKAARKRCHENARKAGRTYAYTVVQRALKKGIIHKKNICSECLKESKTHFHHYLGYAKEHRLSVKEICTSCHGEEHTSALYL